MHIYININIYTNIRIYKCIHTYIHTYSPTSWCGLHEFKCQEGYELQGGKALLLCNLGSWHTLKPADNYSAVTGR